MAKTILFEDIQQLLTMKKVVQKKGRSIEDADLSPIRNASFLVQKGQIIWVGQKSKRPASLHYDQRISLRGQNVFPGFIDCHTHMVFAGDRKKEFELRNQGVSYQEIARQGGGILNTMKQTRKASLATLIELAQERVTKHLRQGVTTIEIKSGYGLNKKTEEKMLVAANSLKKANIVTTFLGAHAVPKEFKNEQDYLKALKKDLLDIKFKGLSRRVDIFIEKGYFTAQASRNYLEFAKQQGFEVTIHADQLNRTGATRLAIDLGALSADHVICLNKEDKRKLAKSNTTAVLLPTADFYLQCDYPDARCLIDWGGRVALATDYNPGSSPTQNISVVGVLARLQMKMKLSEVIAALTYNSAAALGLHETQGAMLKGYDANFFVSNQSWQDLFYDLSPMPVTATYVKARKVLGARQP